MVAKRSRRVCREKNIAEQTFYRWKRVFGMMDISEARRLKELEKENSELKKMLAEALLKNRVLEAVCEKNCKPGAPARSSPPGGKPGAVLRASRVPRSAFGPVHVWVSGPALVRGRAAATKAVTGAVGATSALRVSADRGVVAPGGLAGGQTTDSTAASG